MNNITESQTILLSLTQLERHPYNRPLGLNREKIDQLKASIQQYGYFNNQPLVVRPLNGKYQIIRGEHRFVACQELGFDKLPCSIHDLDDTEAIIQLIVGNIQTENHPLEIGINASKIVVKDSKKGLSATAYGEKLGISRQNISSYLKAAEVYIYLEQCQDILTLLIEIHKLVEIGKCNQANWLWLHNFIVGNELAFSITADLCKKIRDLDDLITYDGYIDDLFDIPTLKLTIAKQLIEPSPRTRALDNHTGRIRKIQEALDKLEIDWCFYEYDIEKDEIIETPIDLQSHFVDYLKNRFDKQALTQDFIGKIYKRVLHQKRLRTLEQAQTDMEYYRKEKHQKELAELRQIEREQKESTFWMWMRCETLEEIAKYQEVEIDRIKERIKWGREFFGELPEALFEDIPEDDEEPGWRPPIYNIWKQQEITNKIKHYGNSEQTIVENLIYMYTEPFDIVVDPFAGGGSTLDVCKNRFRRCWASDRLPIKERNDIREWDIVEGPPPLEDLWFKVRLMYLDPPYWKQSEGKYSKDMEDLANMSLHDFYRNLSNFVISCAQKMSPDARIALLMGITQWPMEDKRMVDHVSDLIQCVSDPQLAYDFRIVCPYESQQYNAKQVEWAKENRRVLVLNRELVIWRIL